MVRFAIGALVVGALHQVDGYLCDILAVAEQIVSAFAVEVDAIW